MQLACDWPTLLMFLEKNPCFEPFLWSSSMKIVSFAFEHTFSTLAMSKLQTLLQALAHPFSPYFDQQAISPKIAGQENSMTELKRKS